MIRYVCNPQLDFAAVLDLYASVSWSNYTNHPRRLEQAFHQSLFDPSGWGWTNHCLYSGFAGVSTLSASGDWPESS